MSLYLSSKRKHVFAGVGVLLIIFLDIFSVMAQSQPNNPSRGFQPGASYSLSDIEKINTQNGNLILNVPLVSLPKGRGGVGNSVSLVYNSKLYNTDVENLLNDSGRLSLQNMLLSSSEGGWKYATNSYSLMIESRWDRSPFIQCDGTSLTASKQLYQWKVSIYMPDGSKKEFRPAGYNDLLNDGYFSITANGYQSGGCSGSSGGIVTTAPITYYSTDGTYIKLIVDHVVGGYDSGSSNPWTMYMPDGSRITGGGGVPQRIYDRNNNYIEGLTDNFGRSIAIQTNVAPNEDHIVMYGVNNEQLVWKVTWKTISVNTTYKTTGATGGFTRGSTSTQTMHATFRVVDRITFPVQLGSLYYEFGYNTESGGTGWGEISRITLPSGAQATYSFITPTSTSTDNVLRRYPHSRTLTYLAEYDGATSPISEITGYSIGSTSSTVTYFDGSTQTESYGDTLYQNQLSGLVYKTVNSNGSITEQTWMYNTPSGANTSALINPYVKTEFTTIPDNTGSPSITAIKDFTLDPNGNITTVKEYDWVPYSSIPRDSLGQPSGVPTGATLKRITATNYYNSSTGNASNAYWALGSPNVRNAVNSVEIQDGAGSPISRSEMFYDDESTTANLTQTKVWDSSKGAYSNPLSASNSISTSATYNSYGMPLTATDANGNVTQITYGNVQGPNGNVTDLYPTQTVTAYGTSVARTSSAVYDFYTGLVTSATDVDNNASTVTEYDALGRPTKVRTATGTPLEAWTTTEYDDVVRRVIVRSDLNALGDGKKVGTQFYDQLGRVRLSKTLEDAATQSATNETDGIKVQTRYSTDYNSTTGVGHTYTLTSNPYRAATSSAASSEQTMGWTLSTSLNTGRHSQVETFSGASLPAPWGSNTGSTGLAQTDIDANATTVTDQAGKLRRSLSNGLGQLIRVDEPDNSNNLGTVSVPVQPTYYTYNTLGKMVHVQQGVQNRYFLYDSLGRLLRVRQPEQEVNTALNTTQAVDGNTQWTAGSTYDANGNVLTTTDAKGTTITSTYDALNRPLTRTYSDGTPTVTNFYDGTGLSPAPQYSKGKLTKTTSSVSESRYTQFDNTGKLLQSQQVTDGQTYTSSYQYNLSGALIQETYPSGRVVNNTLDTNGDLSRIYGKKTPSSTEVTYADSFTYTPDNKIKQLKLGNGLWETAQFNTRLQVTEFDLGQTAGASDVWKASYDYGELNTDGTVNALKNSGNIAKQTINFTGLASPLVQFYKYDPLYRLTEAKETSGATQTWIQDWTYDRYGNRTAFTQNIGGIQSSITPSIDSNTNRFAANQGFVFDKNGNVISDASSGGRQFTFNGDNKQTQVKDANNNVIGTYYYDGEGKRVKKVTNLETTTFVYSGGKLVEEYSGSTLQTSYLYAGSQLLATETATDTNYTATDQLGSPRVVTNASGQVVSRRDFLPFGEEIYADGTIRTTANKYSPTGQDAVRQRFTGYQRDLETGLDFAEARYYNNSQGRFTAVDPLLASGKSANPQTFNRYAYVMNNPLMLTDSGGMQAGTKSKDYVIIQTENGPVRLGWPRWVDKPYEKTHIKDAEVGGQPTGLGDHLLQLGSDVVFGGGGSLYNYFAGTVNTINSVANFIDGWPATGHASDAFGYLPYYNYRTPGEQSAALATTLVTLYAGSMSTAGNTASSLGSIEQETGPVAVFRVEGTPNQKLSIGENGNVSITGNKMLWLNFGEASRAESYAARKVADGMPGVEIKSFQVNRSFFNDIRNSAVPESMSSRFPTSPLRGDPSVPNQYGLRPCQFRNLCENIVPGSGTSSPR